MWPANTKKSTLAVIGTSLALVIVLLVRHFSHSTDGSAREQFLRFVPADATSVVFIDFDALRASPFLAALKSWAPQPAEDSEYAQFVRDTGFDYERDLAKTFVAISNHGTTSSTLALAEGKFNRAKIEAFLSRNGRPIQQGSLKVFILTAGANERPLSVTLFSSQRIAITNSENLFSALSDAVHQPGHADWQTHFDRLAGSPVFAVIRQDPAVQAAFGAAAPAGYSSPQLAALLNQLQWISIAGKPEGDVLRAVAEGECPSDIASSQLRDFLQGLQLLAQNGLGDPKLREQMNPEEREAYLDLLKSADIEKIDRADSKSVRVVLTVTPQFLAVAKSASLGTIPSPAADPKPSSQKPTTQKTKPAKKK